MPLDFHRMKIEALKYARVPNALSLWRSDCAAGRWCRGSLQEPVKRITEWDSTSPKDPEPLLASWSTFLVCWGRMTPSSQSLPEEKNAELSSVNLLFRSSSCSLSWGSKELAWPGATTETLALGHRNRKLGSKARPHWRQPEKRIMDVLYLYSNI